MMTDEIRGSSAGASNSRRPSGGDSQVFLNFRGLDTRLTVADVIYDALDRAGVQVFHDDRSIEGGQVIKGELTDAIRNSKIYIPVFSKDYASSKWCLRELAEIIECWEESKKQDEKKTILPIFYDVDVEDVKLRSNLYTTALQRHGDKEVDSWKDALQKAAEIKGWHIRKLGLAELSKVIVEKVCRMLWTSDPEKVPDNYIGVDKPMDDIIKLLDLDALDVRLVAIHGMGGVGKTTLARLVFNKISSGFGQRVAFLSNVREKSQKDDGIVNLQKDLISLLLPVNSLLVPRDADDGVQMMKARLRKEKVLIVLDDLDKEDQLMKLAGELSWFGTGSRIIITTRDIGVIDESEGFYRYKMQEMRPDDALKLFSKLVFNSDSPPEKYDKFSKEVVDTIGRLPLGIAVIASSFKRIYKDEWGRRLEELQEVVDMDVRKQLMIGFEDMENHYKEIFLDIACLFINKELADAKYYWEARKRYPTSGIRVLRRRSLIEIADGNKLRMHGLLRDIGRCLVDETKSPGERSRLWSPEVALKVVRGKKGTKEVEAIKLEKPDVNCSFNYEEFAGLTELKFLELNGGNFNNEDFKKVFSELRWLSWDNCPHEFRATNLCFENLDVLMLSENVGIDYWGGWNEIKAAKNLKVLKCTYRGCLAKRPDFSAFPKLERLVLRICTTLREIDRSIGMLEHLTYLEITDLLTCKKRPRDGCQFEDGEPQILPDSIGGLKSLSVLKLRSVNLPKLPDSIGELANLKNLCLWCPELKELPYSVGDLKKLVELDISHTAITKLPGSVTDLENLKVFKWVNCRLQGVPDKIKRLIASDQLDTITAGKISGL